MNSAWAVGKTQAETDAGLVTRDGQEFLVNHLAGNTHPMPNSVWRGSDCWMIETNPMGWRISDRGRDLAALLASRKPKSTDER